MCCGCCCSLPVVTYRPLHSGAVSGAGESDTGGGQPHGEKIFRPSWRENFKCALLVWLPMLAVLVLCGFDLYFAVLNDRFLW